MVFWNRQGESCPFPIKKKIMRSMCLYVFTMLYCTHRQIIAHTAAAAAASVRKYLLTLFHYILLLPDRF